MDQIEFDYNGRKLAISENGVIWEFRNSRMLPGDPPGWYRYTGVIDSVSKMLFDFARKYEPNIIVKK